MDTIAVIPARGGSKGVPRKNIRKLGGKPLIEYTISAAREIFEDNQIIVSTEDEEIRGIVESIGLEVPFLRPEDLAKDDSSTQDVLIYILDHFEKIAKHVDVIVLLQPTSPFRKGKQIKEALDLFKKNPSLDMVVSVFETSSNPYYVLFEENEQGYLEKSKKGDFVRRQDCPKVWEYNGAIYVINASSLRSGKLSEFSKVKKYVMDRQSSVDIDDELDWMIAEKILDTHHLS